MSFGLSIATAILGVYLIIPPVPSFGQSETAVIAGFTEPVKSVRRGENADEIGSLAFLMDITFSAGLGRSFMASHRLGKMLSFFCFGPEFSNDLCWGPCKEAVFYSYRGSPASSPKEAPEAGRPAVTATTLSTLMNSGVPLLIVDAQKPPGKKRIPGSITFPVASQPKDIPTIVVVYGEKELGAESRAVAESLRKSGFGNVVELKEGFEGWRIGGFPVEKTEKQLTGSD